MLIQTVNTGGDNFAEAELARDGGAAFTACRDEFSRKLLAMRRQMRNASRSLFQAAAQASVREYEAGDLDKMIRIDCLETTFNGVIRAIEFTQSRGIATAACILEQQSVVKVPQHCAVDIKLFPAVHPDPAAAQAVAGRLSRRQIKRIAECTNSCG